MYKIWVHWTVLEKMINDNDADGPCIIPIALGLTAAGLKKTWCDLELIYLLTSQKYIFTFIIHPMVHYLYDILKIPHLTSQTGKSQNAHQKIIQ